MDIDIKRFNFIRSTGDLARKLNQKVEEIISSPESEKPYRIEWENVLSDYHEKGKGDVYEFACSYVFAWHSANNHLENDVSKQAMYLEIAQRIWLSKM